MFFLLMINDTINLYLENKFYEFQDYRKIMWVEYCLTAQY